MVGISIGASRGWFLCDQELVFNSQKYWMKLIVSMYDRELVDELSIALLKNYKKGRDKFNICACSNVAIHICICQLRQFLLILPCSGVDIHGNTSTPNWLRMDLCQRQTHVVENRFAPCKMLKDLHQFNLTYWTAGVKCQCGGCKMSLRTSLLCSYFLWSSGVMDCMLLTLNKVPLMRLGRQWCGIFHYPTDEQLQ